MVRRISISAASVCTAVAVVVLPEALRTEVANWLLFTICGLSWAFVSMYGFRSYWRTTIAGRALMYITLSLALMTSQVSVSLMTESDYPFRDEVRLVLYSTLALTLLNLLWTLWIVQHTPWGGDSNQIDGHLEGEPN